MRIGIDISQIAHGGGVGIYTDQLTNELIKQKDIDWVFFYSLLRKKYRGSLSNVKNYPIPPTLLEILFNRIRLFSIEAFIGSVDIFHSSDWMQPPSKAKKVTTYHDLVPILYPQWSDPRAVSVHKKRLEIVEKEIDLVIAVSQATKKDLLKVSNILEKKIVVIYEGVSENFKPQQEKEIVEFKKRYNLPEKFVLAIGGVGERRNLQAVKEASRNYNLVIAGVTIPWLDHSELPLLYASSSCLLYPSFYEGFGLPILEAMACGVPVITSNISSMPEIGGGAGLYVNPKNVSDITNKLKEAMEDEKLREDLIKKGLTQAKKFSWQKCAEETVEVYKSLVNEK